MKLACWTGVAAITIAGVLGGCTMTPPENPAKIDVRPSYPVRFATEQISPAVVRIDVLSESFYEGQARDSRAIGSGVIIDKEGHVLTNFHVAGRAKRLDVTLYSLDHVRAHLIGSDHWTDLALIQLDMAEVKKKGLSFSFAPLGNSSEVTLGQPVMAVGTPFGLTRTVTAGIISNTDRFFDESSIDGYETGWFNNWIQMDAAINPGNSGGPLINLKGEVIGINTRGISAGNNLGFAIPIDVAKNVIKDLLAHGKVTRSYIGVQLQPLEDLETYYGTGNKGVLIASVERDSPAAKAGLKAEDILLSVNGAPVSVRFPEQLASVRKLLSDYPAGAALDLEVRHSGKGDPVIVRVATEVLESRISEQKSVAAWGMTVRDITRAYLRERQLPSLKGVLVTGTQPGSLAETAQFETGDIILKVDDKPVTNTDELLAAVAAWQRRPRLIGVDVHREHGTVTLVIKP